MLGKYLTLEKIPEKNFSAIFVYSITLVILQAGSTFVWAVQFLLTNRSSLKFSVYNVGSVFNSVKRNSSYVLYNCTKIQV